MPSRLPQRAPRSIQKRKAVPDHDLSGPVTSSRPRHLTRSKLGLTPGCATAEPQSYLARSKLCAGCSRRATRAKSASAAPS
eukprot:scaffold34791_cov58-Phaeocystis_antarctica.AAC.3